MPTTSIVVLLQILLLFSLLSSSLNPLPFHPVPVIFHKIAKYCLFRALVCCCPHVLRLLGGTWHSDGVVGGTGSPAYIWSHSCGGTSQTWFTVSPSHSLPKTGICILCNLCSGRAVRHLFGTSYSRAQQNLGPWQGTSWVAVGSGWSIVHSPSPFSWQSSRCQVLEGPMACCVDTGTLRTGMGWDSMAWHSIDAWDVWDAGEGFQQEKQMCMQRRKGKGVLTTPCLWHEGREDL